MAVAGAVRQFAESHWSYDAERDIFSVRLGRPGRLVQEKSTGRARVDDRRSVVDLQVALGDGVTWDDRDLTFLDEMD
jgi:hypothetical protein